jgi:hypothetical protein
MLTIVTPEVHSEDEHAIVVLPSDAWRTQAAHIQDQLVRIFGDAIWLQRPSGLHCTVMEIICNAVYEGMSRQEHFEQWYAQYNETVKTILSGCSPFEIVFDELFVSERAIIIKAADSGPLNEIRARILAQTKLPEGTKQPPQITHCSLARFAKPIDLDDAVRQTRDIPVHIVEQVTELALAKDLGPPQFDGTPLQTYPLSF